MAGLICRKKLTERNPKGSEHQVDFQPHDSLPTQKVLSRSHPGFVRTEGLIQGAILLQKKRIDAFASQRSDFLLVKLPPLPHFFFFLFLKRIPENIPDEVPHHFPRSCNTHEYFQH